MRLTLLPFCLNGVTFDQRLYHCWKKNEEEVEEVFEFAGIRFANGADFKWPYVPAIYHKQNLKCWKGSSSKFCSVVNND